MARKIINKGGHPSDKEKTMIKVRNSIMQRLNAKYNGAQLAIVFNLHKSAVSRILANKK